MWTEIWAVLLTCCGQNCGNDRGLTPRGPQGGLGPWRHPGPPLCPLWGFVRPQGSREPGATRATRTGRGDRGAVELLAGLLFGDISMAPTENRKKKARQEMPGQQLPCARVTPPGPCRPCRPGGLVSPLGPRGPLGPHKSPQWYPVIPQGPSDAIVHITSKTLSVFLSTFMWTEIWADFPM